MVDGMLKVQELNSNTDNNINIDSDHLADSHQKLENVTLTFLPPSPLTFKVGRSHQNNHRKSKLQVD